MLLPAGKGLAKLGLIPASFTDAGEGGNELLRSFLQTLKVSAENRGWPMAGNDGKHCCAER